MSQAVDVYFEESQRPAHCNGRNCGARIIWRETIAGKKMPFNERGFVALETYRDAATGRLVERVDAALVHWVSCVDSSRFRPSTATVPKGTVKCAVSYCIVRSPSTFALCAAHWKMVPESIVEKVYRFYRRGQEVDGNVSAEYSTAVKDAADHVARVERGMFAYPLDAR